jgi:hypothetical protein
MSPTGDESGSVVRERSSVRKKYTPLIMQNPCTCVVALVETSDSSYTLRKFAGPYIARAYPLLPVFLAQFFVRSQRW